MNAATAEEPETMRLTSVCWGLSILVSAAIAAPAAKGADFLPNFVFILADDQAWNGLSVPMAPGKAFSRSREFHTPNLERLAAQGVTFSQAYASHCKCECLCALILTGRTTTSLNATDKHSRNWEMPASDCAGQYAEARCALVLRAHLGKWQWQQSPASMGDDVSDGITQNEDGESSDPRDPKQSFSLTRCALAFMEKQVKESHPFYLQISYYAVHPPAQALASTLKKYEGVVAPGGRGDRHVLAAMTEDLDGCVGDILKTIEALGISGKTYVIYMSDNGGAAQGF